MSTTITPAAIRKQVHVKARPERAFEIFTVGMSSWWLKTHTINGTKSPIKDIVIEPQEGGRWLERGEDGSECQWGKVLAWEPPTRLLLAWQINAQWQFDATVLTEVEISFTADGTGTLVTLEHRHLERLGDAAEAMRKAFEGGWTSLLEQFAAKAV